MHRWDFLRRRRDQVFENSNLIARLELRTPEAILPNLQRELAALDFSETQLGEEFLYVGKSENRVQMKLPGFVLDCLNQHASDALAFHVRMNSERADLPNRRTVEVQSSAANQPVSRKYKSEIPDILRHFEFCARQHHTLCCVAVD